MLCKPEQLQGVIIPHRQGRDKAMAQAVVWIGIDVSKDRLDVFVRPHKLRFSVVNDDRGHDELIARLEDWPGCMVAMEASGGYERAVHRRLDKAGLWTRLLNPLHVRRFAQAAGKRAKNDRLDAEIIAHYAATFPRPEPVTRDPGLDRLVEHVLYRSQLVEAATAAENQLAHFADRRLKNNLARRIAALKAQAKTIDQRIATLLAAWPHHDARATLLRSVPGVGPVLAATLIALLPELGALPRKQIASLVGVAPFDDDSGLRHGLRSIAGGRATVRNVLYMASLTAIRHNPVIAAYAQRLKALGKKPKVVIVACMRKLIVTLNAMVRDAKPWNLQKAAA
jgi:transposase